MTDEPIGPDEDAAIVAKCRAGDPDAFEAIVEKHQKRMLNIAFRMTGSYEDACEVVQDAFVAAYRSLAEFRGASRFSTWLSAIVMNLARNRLLQMRSRERREPVSLDDPLGTDSGHLVFEPAATGPSVLERLEQEDVSRMVQECINRLEADFRGVVVLRDIQGFSYSEISAILKLAEGTVKSRLFRARDALRECLEKLRKGL